MTEPYPSFGKCSSCGEPIYSSYGHMVNDSKGVFFRCKDTERYAELIDETKARQRLIEVRNMRRFMKKYPDDARATMKEIDNNLEDDR